MKAISVLFEEYKQGKLSEEKIKALSISLIEKFFYASDEIDREQTDYTIDIIAHQFLRGELETKYIEPLRTKIKNEQPFAKRFHFLITLDEAVETSKNIHNLNAVEAEDIKEEEQLEQMLREVVEEASVEMETSSFSWSKQFEKATNRLKIIINQLTPNLQWSQPEYRLIAIVASVAVLAIVIWFNITPDNKKQMALIETVDSLQINDIKNDKYAEHDAEEESTTRTDKKNLRTQTDEQPTESDIIEMKKREKLSKLLASNFEVSPRFNYTLTRSTTTSATDSLVIAAKNYNERKYEECNTVLNDLIQRESFTDRDTTSMINFYMGNLYLAMGMERSDYQLITKSINAFLKVHEDTPFYHPSKWYASLAYLKLGNTSEALRLLDTLYLANYLRDGKVETMRDSIETIIKEY